MEHARAKQRLIRILGIAPELREIMLSTLPLEEKRKKIREFIVNLISYNFNDDTAIEPLEWVVTRDAIRVFRSIFSIRNERLLGKSLLKYMDDLLHLDTLKGMEKPSSGFFAELEHLLKGLMGKAGIYTEKVPVFSKHQGTKAARLRSANLSQMTRKSRRFLDRYPCGLDSDAIHRRSVNKARILNHFGATELEWEDWKWHSRHIIRDADTLNDLVKLNEEEFQAVMLAREHKIPFGITPYYLSLIDNDSDHSRDYAVRAQVIPPLSYVQAMKTAKEAEEHSMDFMLERDTSPIEGITRRYPMIAILKPISTCPQICVYCQRNWEIEDVYSSNAVLTKEKLEKAFQWLEDTPEVIEVLITGGDPFLLSNKKIEYLLSRLSRIKHIQRIRIGTRTLVTLPQRINESLVSVINRFHSPGKREILIITHFEHPYEITLQSMEAVQKFRHYGIDVYNQLVYTFYNSRKFEASALRLKLRSIGVTPYYTFNTKGKEETNEYRVPIPRLLQEQKEEARLLPGSVRTDEIVFNVPGLGKNYLRASQHRDIISILPDGRRVYEFHPWEKQLSLVDTYLYNDVSIYDYLKRLKAAGEDTSQYKTIWYYY